MTAAKQLLLVALGGGLGAVCRYGLIFLPVGGAFPVRTLLTNLAGAVLIGLIAGLSGQISDNAALFWKTGVCGGFTTFSTFSLETAGLLEEGKLLAGGAYILLSVGLCLAGVWLGRRLAGR